MVVAEIQNQSVRIGFGFSLLLEKATLCPFGLLKPFRDPDHPGRVAGIFGFMNFENGTPRHDAPPLFGSIQAGKICLAVQAPA